MHWPHLLCPGKAKKQKWGTVHETTRDLPSTMRCLFGPLQDRVSLKLMMDHGWIDHYMYVWIRYCLSSFYALLSSLLFYTFFMSCWLRSLSLELFTSDERRFCKLSAWNNNKIAKLSQRSQEINKRQMQIRTLVYRLVKLKETYS